MHGHIEWMPKIPILKLVINWTTQVDLHRKQDEHSKDKPATDGHHLVENDVLAPHFVIFVAKESGGWIVKVERDVWDEHPWKEG